MSWVSIVIFSDIIAILLVQIVILYALLKLIKIIKGILEREGVELETTTIVEDQPGDAVVDSSPAHVRAKKEERERKGEDAVDEDSQIVNTKTPEQIANEAESAKEARLDKWMPGAKHDK